MTRGLDLAPGDDPIFLWRLAIDGDEIGHEFEGSLIPVSAIARGPDGLDIRLGIDHFRDDLAHNG